ncbi:MAG: nitrate- and nitrite sensing domain-containing protein, partial [Rhodospirillaceae bacterium]|nr:nitrate- and nitrite sensing domain-containing protein [Rhodospirillaceae bacterium]
FNSFATAEARRFAHDTLAGPVLAEVERMRAIAIESYSAGNVGGIQASEWFRASTARIDLMKAVEDHLNSNLGILSSRAEAEANRSLMLIGVSVLLILAAAVSAAWATGRSISVP